MKITNWRVLRRLASVLIVAALCWVFYNSGYSAGSSDSGDDKPTASTEIHATSQHVGNRSDVSPNAKNSIRSKTVHGRDVIPEAEQGSEPSLLATGWTLSSRARNRFDLTNAEYRESQKKISETYTQLQDWVGESCFYDETLSDDTVDIYRLAAMPEGQRDSILSKLRTDLEASANSRFANEMIEDLNGTNYFGGLGKYDVVLEFRKHVVPVIDGNTGRATTNQTENANDALVSFTYLNPETGNMILETQNADLDYFESFFGRFEVAPKGTDE